MARAEASGSRVAPDRGAYEDPLPEFVARRTAVCFSFLFAFPRTTATRARSADASTSKTSRVVEMAMSTRMTERDKENEHRASNAEASHPVARTRLKPAVQKTKRKGLESAVAVPSSKRSTPATGRVSSPRPRREPEAVAVYAETPYRSLAEAFLRASSVDADPLTPRPAGANANEDSSLAYPPAFAPTDDPMDVDGDGDVDIDAVVRSLRSTAVVAAAMDDASRELSGDFPSSPSGNVAEVFDPFDAFAVLERAEPFEPQDAGFLMAAKHGAVGVAPDEPAHEAAALQRAAALAGSLAAFPEEHGFQEGFFRDARAETSAAARFEAFEREKRSVSRNADAPPPGVAVVDAHVLRGGALLDPGRRWVEVEPGWFVVQ